MAERGYRSEDRSKLVSGAMWMRGVALVVMAGCAVDEVVDESTVEQEAAATYPWKQPAKWPFNVQSSRMVVHYQTSADLAMAQTILGDVEDAWSKQMTTAGSRVPLDDGGLAGPDGRFDVYIQQGLGSLYVAAIAANTSTTWDDYSTAMVLDPWSVYGGAEMRPNIFHELRHASQAVDDWYEQAWLFEAEATFWEAVYYGYERIAFAWADYQLHPEWTPFKNDRYSTWYMYGGAMFFAHLRKTVFNNTMTFSNDMWLGSRNPAGTNEPDWVDALGPILAAKGTTVFDQVVSFARARWYTGSRANAQIIDGATAIAEVATRSHVRASGATKTTFIPNPEVLGTIYTTITKAPTDGSTLKISLSNIDAKARPIVQVVGQTNGDRILDLTNGQTQTVTLTGNTLTLAVTMLPSNGQFDVDSPGTQAYKATVNVER